MQHVDELGLVGRSEYGEIGNRPQVREVEDAVMCGTVLAHEASPVETEHDVQALQDGVHDDLIVGALQERRVDGHDRHHAAMCQPGGKAHRMLLGDADVEEPVGEALGERAESRAGRHGRRDSDDARIALGLGNERLPEDLGVCGRTRRHTRDFARRDGERSDAVEKIGLPLGGRVSHTLAGDRVDDDRTVGVLGPRHGVLHLLDVVPVDRTHVLDAELLEEHSGHQQLLHRLLGRLTGRHHGRAEPRARERALDIVTQPPVAAIEPDSGEVTRERTHIGSDGHLVVVQQDDEARAEMPRVIERLEGHAAGERAVADDRHDRLVPTAKVACGGEAERDRYGVARVAGVVDVVGALRPLRKAAHAPVRPQRIEAAAASGQQFVDVGLVTHVPDDLVTRAVERAMQTERQLDHAEIGGEMASGE